MESLSTHEQLAAITGKRVAQLSGPEAERRLRLATNMIQRLQAVVRLWLKRVRKRREGYKVTMRTELSYASSSPADRNQDKIRRIRVQQHGWRAPLSRRYQPLGEPRLELDRKPVQQAVAVHRHHRQTREEREHTFLGHGETMYGNVAKFGFAYFETYVVDAKASLLVTVEALGGDPDLFMSRTNAHPNVATATWVSSDLGADAIEVLPSDPEFGVGTYYIAVYGGGGGAECRFNISVESRRQLGGAVHAQGASASDTGLAVRTHVAAANERRMKVKSGASGVALMAEAGGPHSGRSPQQRLDALSVLPREGGADVDIEAHDRLSHALRVRLPFALGAAAPVSRPGAASVSVEWAAHVLSRLVTLRTLEKGEALVYQEDPAAFVAFVLKGELQVAAATGAPHPPRPKPHSSRASPAAGGRRPRHARRRHADESGRSPHPLRRGRRAG